MKKLHLLGVCCAYALAFVTSSANAATISYHSQADYLSALGGAVIITQNFDTLATGTVIADGATLDGATFSYTLGPPGNPSIVVDDFFDTTSGDKYLGTDDGSGAFVGGDGLTITFDQTMHAIGLYVISADLILSGDFTITTNNGQSVSNVAISDVTLVDGEAYFLGLIEDDFSLGFDSITLSSIEDDYLFNVDDVTVSAVPLPAAVWLFGGGLLGLVAMSRRTMRKS